MEEKEIIAATGTDGGIGEEIEVSNIKIVKEGK